VGPLGDGVALPVCAREKDNDGDDVWVAVQLGVTVLDLRRLQLEVGDAVEERDWERETVGVRVCVVVILNFGLGEAELEQVPVRRESVGVRVMLEQDRELLGLRVRAESDSVAPGLEESVGVEDAEMLVWVWLPPLPVYT